jgi:hypothetical protein
MNQFSTTKCFCGQRTVGFVSDLSVTEWLCNKHWWARKSVIDKKQDEQEKKQWAHFNEKPQKSLFG